MEVLTCCVGEGCQSGERRARKRHDEDGRLKRRVYSLTVGMGSWMNREMNEKDREPERHSAMEKTSEAEYRESGGIRALISVLGPSRGTREEEEEEEGKGR